MGKKQVTSAAAKVVNKAKTAKKTEQKKTKGRKGKQKGRRKQNKAGGTRGKHTNQGRNGILNIKIIN